MGNEESVSQLVRLKSKLIADYGFTAQELSDLTLENVLEIYLAATDADGSDDAAELGTASADMGPKTWTTPERESPAQIQRDQAFPVEHGRTPPEDKTRPPESAPGFSVAPLSVDSPAASFGARTPAEAAAKKRTKRKWRIGVVVAALAIGGTVSVLSALEDGAPTVTADSSGQTTERIQSQVSVPSVVGLSLTRAASTIHNSGLKGTVNFLGTTTYPPVSDYPNWVVVIQTPKAGTDLDRRSTVNVEVRRTAPAAASTPAPTVTTPPAPPPPPPPVTVLQAQTYTVGRGPGLVAPGTYEIFNVTNCYWERLDSAGNILDNNFINGAPRAEFTIRESDYAINIEGCGGWTLVP